LPFTSKWCGIIHHTFDEEFSLYNSTVLFENPDFLLSLKFCLSIIVLSNYMKKKILLMLSTLNINNINVVFIKHPTEFVNGIFNYNSFCNNKNKLFLQIGAWYRDTFSIMTINTPSCYKKSILKGLNMDSYYPDLNYMSILSNSLYSFGNGIIERSCCASISKA